MGNRSNKIRTDWSEVGGGHALLRTAHIFLLPGRVERGGGPGPGFLRPYVRPSVRIFAISLNSPL